MYNCCFLACFCASQRVQRRKAELTLAQIREKLTNGWANWHKIWHTCANSYGIGYMPNKLPLETQWGTWRVLGGQQFKSLGKLSDWHQLWFTSADSSRNGHRLNTCRPSIPQGAFRGGGLGCHTFKSLGKLSNGWTDWDQIWHTSVDPPGNGYTPNAPYVSLLET